MPDGRSPSSQLDASTQIKLTERENLLRKLLIDVAFFIDQSKTIKERLELRFAGGWVRDKLLEIPSNDIDTAINSMTGDAFSRELTRYLENPVNRKKHCIGDGELGNMHKIAANPEKSKHLETVTTKILGFDVDFVNLRKETYSDDSRNPQMDFGTAQEDALRRDATVNALFFNLHTEKVEDFAGGLADLQAKRIRTPLEPYQTFLDDPLRVLRLIRFASRLGFEIDRDSGIVMSDPSIRIALRLKISRERIGIELEKMLKEKDPEKPRKALQLIDELGLYLTIFTDPTAINSPKPGTSQWRLAYDCLSYMMNMKSSPSIYDFLVYKDRVGPAEGSHRPLDTPLIAWILSALSPYARISTPTNYTRNSRIPFGATVAKEGIKSPSRVCSIVTGAFRNFEQIAALKRAVNQQESWISERDTLGMKIRRWEKDGGHWRLQALLAILVEAMALPLDTDFSDLLLSWQRFLDHLQKMNLLNAEYMKPLVDGSDLKQGLGATPGRWMAPALDICLEWQFRNPEATDIREAIEEIRNRAVELEVSFASPRSQ